MPRITTVAGALGVLTGIWTLAASLLDGVGYACPAGGCPPSGTNILGALVTILGIGLTFNSVVSFFWRKQVHYVSAILSALIAIVAYMNGVNFDLVVFLITTVLCLFTTATSLLAARSGTSMSEQGNPMNLPVFG